MPEATLADAMTVPALPERGPAEKSHHNNGSPPQKPLTAARDPAATPGATLKDATTTAPAAPGRGPAAGKANNNNGPLPAAQTQVTIPLVNELQLTAATGGTELSCYRCTVPFGVVVLIAGVVVTAVAYSFNSHGSTISYLGLVLLASGLALLASSVACWKMRSERKKEQRRESQTALVVHRRSIFTC